MVLKEHRVTIGIGLPRIKLGDVSPKVETVKFFDGSIKTRKSSIKRVAEEVYDNLVKMSDELKFLAG